MTCISAKRRRIYLTPSDIALTLWFCPREERIARELRQIPKVEREKVWADLSGDDRLGVYNDAGSNGDSASGTTPGGTNDETDRLLALLSRTLQERDGLLAPGETLPREYGKSVLDRFRQEKRSSVTDYITSGADAYFREQKRLFGFMDRHVRWSDLTAAEQDLARGDMGRFLGQPDKSGRRVCITSFDALMENEATAAVSQKEE